MLDPRGRRACRLSTRRGLFLVVAIATVVTLLLARDVVRSPRQRIFGSDRVLSVDAPNRDALATIAQIENGEVQAPYVQPLTDVPAHLLSRAVGPVAAYNLMVLSTFPLAAAAAYALGVYVLRSTLASVFVGLFYAFLPVHVSQAGGHVHIAQTQWLPLYLLALWRCFDAPTFIRGCWLILAAAAVSLSSLYFGFIAAVLTPVALLGRLIAPLARDGTPARARLARTLVPLLIALTLGVIAFQWLETGGNPPSMNAFPRADLFDWSARWWSYLVPPAEHPFIAPWVAEFWVRHGFAVNQLEHQQVSVGFSALLLAVIGIASWTRTSPSPASGRLLPALALVAMTALLCSLSPERQIGGLVVLRPSSLLHDMFPMFRAYSRFSVAVGLMVALLAGAGGLALCRRRGGRVLTAGLVGFALLETLPPLAEASRDILPSEAHRWVTQAPGLANVLDCGAPTEGLSTQPRVGNAVFHALGSSTVDDCGDDLVSALRALRFDSAVMRKHEVVAHWLENARGQESDGLTLREFGDSWLITSSPGDVPAFTQNWSGFFPREYDVDRSWRWMAQTGVIRIRASSPAPLFVTLQLRSFPAERVITWSIDGTARGQLSVGPAWKTFTLRTGALGRGSATLAFTSMEPAVAASTALANGDDRIIALAVGPIRFSDPTAVRR